MRKTTLATISLMVLVSFLWSCQKESKSAAADSIASLAHHDYKNSRVLILPSDRLKGKGTRTIYGGGYTIESSDLVISLGLVIFYDQTISTTSLSTCAVCHKGKLAFADVMTNEKRILNMTPTGGSTIPLAEQQMTTAMIWSGGASAGSKNANLNLIKSHEKLGIESMDVLPSKMAGKAYYQKLFKDAYGTSEITPERIISALDQFLNEVPAHNSDDYRFVDPFAK